MNNNNKEIFKRFESKVHHQNQIYLYREYSNGQRIVTSRSPIQILSQPNDKSLY